MRIGIGNSITNYASQFAGSGGAAFPDYDLSAISFAYWDAHFIDEQYSSANTYPGVVDDLVNRAENLGTGPMPRFQRIAGNLYLREHLNTYYWEKANTALFYSTYAFPSLTYYDIFVLMRTSAATGIIVSDEDTNPKLGQWANSGSGANASSDFDNWYVDGVDQGGYTGLTQNTVRLAIQTGEWIIVRFKNVSTGSFDTFEICNDANADVALAAIIAPGTATTNLTDIMTYLEARRDILNS